MEFYLVDNKSFTLTGFTRTRYGSTIAVYSSRNITLEPLARFYCKPLLDSVSASLLNAVSAQDEDNPTLQLHVVVPYLYPSRLQICSGDGLNVFKMIRDWCGEVNVRINLKLDQSNLDVDDSVDCFEAKDLPIKNLSERGNPCGFGCDCDMTLSLARSCDWLTVSMKLTQEAVDSFFLQRFAKTNLAGGYKRLLEDAVCSDMVILAANGTEIKCHKAMLAVQSDVFKTMFENKMKESITSVVEMPDMSEKTVRAFLGFIYCGNMKEASESCDIALDLFVAADKYNVSGLMSAIAELIAVMPNEWFNVEMSLNLLIFTERQQEICENKDFMQLQEKVIRVLKSDIKDSLDILLNSDVYQQLFRIDPETAMKISVEFLSE